MEIDMARTHGPGFKNTIPSNGQYRARVAAIIEKCYGGVLHHKQNTSIAMLTFAVVCADQLGVAALGKALALANGTNPKHGTKQVDRFLSNNKMNLRRLFEPYVRMLIGPAGWIPITIDWTDFDGDNHTTICVSLLTGSKRGLPLIWLSVDKANLKDMQKEYERRVLRMLAEILGNRYLDVVVLADRGFGDVDFYSFLEDELGFRFIVRYKEGIYTSEDGWLYPSIRLVPKNGRVKVIRDAYVTGAERGPYTVVLYKAAGMKDAWCLVTNLRDTRGRSIVNLYGRRFECEEGFRDLKDRRYGYGLSSVRISDCRRRDRFLILFALAYVVLTLFGAASEHLGLDRTIRANTEESRTHSLFHQGQALLGRLKRDVFDSLRRAADGFFRTFLKEGACVAIP